MRESHRSRSCAPTAMPASLGYKTAIEKAHQMADGDRIVAVDVQPYFRGGVEDIDQLEAALAGLREECERLIADGKKIVVD